MKKLFIFFILLITIIVSIILYSRYIGTKGLNIKEYKIKNSEIKDDFYGLKIVHISDIHYGMTTDIEELKKIVKKINLIKPDIVLFTGDLFDETVSINEKDEEKLINILSEIDSKMGKYAIKGEDDVKFSNWNNIIENSGFKDLDNTYDLIYGKNNKYILVSGMSTNLGDNTNIEDKIKSTTQFMNDTQEKPIYSILMMHEADFIDEFDYSPFNLILAGHFHGGQINIPGIDNIYNEKGAKKYNDEFYKFDNTLLYISSGIGTTRFKFRLFNPPSINLYRLVN